MRTQRRRGRGRRRGRWQSWRPGRRPRRRARRWPRWRFLRLSRSSEMRSSCAPRWLGSGARSHAARGLSSTRRSPPRIAPSSGCNSSRWRRRGVQQPAPGRGGTSGWGPSCVVSPRWPRRCKSGCAPNLPCRAPPPRRTWPRGPPRSHGTWPSATGAPPRGSGCCGSCARCRRRRATRRCARAASAARAARTGARLDRPAATAASRTSTTPSSPDYTPTAASARSTSSRELRTVPTTRGRRAPM